MIADPPLALMRWCSIASYHSWDSECVVPVDVLLSYSLRWKKGRWLSMNPSFYTTYFMQQSC